MEFSSHRDFYDWVLDNLTSGRRPTQTEFARLNIDYTVMSKRKLKRLVEEGLVGGWDDPRMPTISGLRRRGYTPKSIRDFCETISVTRKESVVSYLLLEETLRNDLNKSANRLMGVFDPIKLTITNWDSGTEWVEIENNPEDATAGSRMVPFSGELYIEREDFSLAPDKKYFRLKMDGEVRLKGGYVVKATDVVMDKDKVIEVKCTYDPLSKSGMTLDRKVKGVIHWVSVEHGIRMNVNEYDKLFISPSPDDNEDDFINYLNSESLIINDKAVFEPNIIILEVGESVQMMRKGYYCLDKDRMSFNKTVNLKEGWKV